MDSHQSSMRNLECSVCFGSYNNEGKRPRVLPCGHTFCSSCISDNLLSGEIRCPHCRNLHRANSNTEFPPNFDLEKMIQYHTYNLSDRMETCDFNPGKCKSMSKNLRIQIAEANFRVEILSNKSREISSHLQQYNSYIDDGLAEHEHILHHHDIIDMSFKKESSRVSDSITEEENKRTKMEKARTLLASASDTPETLLALEEVNIRCDDLERWNKITTEIFPKENLITSVKEIRVLSKEIPLRFSDCGQDGIKDKDEEAEEEMEREERDTDEDNQDLKPSQYQDSMLRDVKVKENQEPFTDEPLNKADNASSSQTIQDKVLDALEKMSPWKVDKAIQTEERVHDMTTQTISQTGLNGYNRAITIAFMWIPIILFTIIYLTSCLHTAWVEWEDVPHTLTTEDLVEMTPLARHMLESNRVFAVHEDGRGEAGRRYARISLEEADTVYIHVLEKISTESLPKDAVILQFGDFIEKLDVLPQYTFLELGVGGGNDGGRSLGKLIIRLVPQSKISLNFFFLCTGQMGPSYTNSSLLLVYSQDTKYESVSFGDYETNNGLGGKAVMPGVNWWKHNENHNKEYSVKGMVAWSVLIKESTASMFEIYTGDNPQYTIPKDGIIGTVVKGLHILSKAIKDYEYITDVKVIDTGVILPQKICRNYVPIYNR